MKTQVTSRARQSFCASRRFRAFSLCIGSPLRCASMRPQPSLRAASSSAAALTSAATFFSDTATKRAACASTVDNRYWQGKQEKRQMRSVGRDPERLWLYSWRFHCVCRVSIYESPNNGFDKPKYMCAQRTKFTRVQKPTWQGPSPCKRQTKITQSTPNEKNLIKNTFSKRPKIAWDFHLGMFICENCSSVPSSQSQRFTMSDSHLRFQRSLAVPGPCCLAGRLQRRQEV